MVILVIRRLAWGITNRGSTVNKYYLYIYYIFIIYIYYTRVYVKGKFHNFTISHFTISHFSKRYSVSSIKNFLTLPQRHVYVACKDFISYGQLAWKKAKIRTSADKMSFLRTNLHPPFLCRNFALERTKVLTTDHSQQTTVMFLCRLGILFRCQ